MTRLFLLLAMGAGCLIAGDVAAVAKSGERARAAASQPGTHISVARRHARAHIRMRPRAYAAPLPAPAPTGFRPADPSFGPYYSLWAARRQEPNRCIEDLGYGRWRYCDWD
jgi:hypothetical protein